MKRLTLLVVLTVAAVLLLAGLASAAPGDYSPHITSDKYTWTSEAVYGDAIGFVEDVFASKSYWMLDPRQKDVNAFVNPYTVVNANRTGEAPIGGFTNFRRAIDTQNVHTDFQKNTNSCASCHMTHTAQGTSLLFRAGVFATCTTCHDGTGIPFFNVFKPSAEIVTDIQTAGAGEPIFANQYRVSGTFGVDPRMSASVHLATGDMTLAAAPGGNRVAKKWDGTADTSGEWTKQFTCASCHAPHGSHSFRLLHFNPNGMARRAKTSGGLLNTVQAFVYDAGTGRFTIPTAPTPWLYGYDVSYPAGVFTRTYYLNIYDQTAPGTQLTGKFKINYKDGYMVAKDAASFTTVKAAYDAGNLVADVPSLLKVEGPYTESTVPGSKWFTGMVSTDGGMYPFQSGDKVVYKDGLNYNLFCAACHTDYERKLTTAVAFGRDPNMTQDVANGETLEEFEKRASEASALTGIFSKAHRHTTWRGATAGRTMEVIAYNDTGTKATNANFADKDGNIMCVSCHFVHGTDSLLMKTADEKIIGVEALTAGHPIDPTAGNYDTTTVGLNKDINLSSAIKRYTNMSVCWKCHTESKSAVFKNTKYFWDNKAGQSSFDDDYGYNW